MYEKVRSNCANSFSIRLVPRFRFKNFGLVDERAVIAEHTFVWGKGQRCHKEMKERECGVRRDGVGVGDVVGCVGVALGFSDWDTFFSLHCTNTDLSFRSQITERTTRIRFRLQIH